MQTRTSFNGGEQSPEMAARCDIDSYMRGCKVLENWEVAQMGGVKRRRGMRYFAPTVGGKSKLLPYVYSYADGHDLRFLVECGEEELVVRTLEGDEEARFKSAEGSRFHIDTERVKWKQLNAVLFIVSGNNHPMALRRDSDGTWSFKKWEFKNVPWRFENEKRDHEIEVECKADGEWDVIFSDKEEENEKITEYKDKLRVSFWVDEKEAFARSKELRDGVQVVTSVCAAGKGEKFAVHKEDTIRYYVCTKEWPLDVYVAGLDEPECYKDNFLEAENLDGFDDITPVYSVKDVTGGGIGKGKKFAIKSGYWHYYTCVKDFAESDISGMGNEFDDYPGHFVRGLAVGDAVACRGAWNFYCSGLWYGSYEVRKHYEGSELNTEWESCGSSFSRIGEASNTQLSGDESDEICWLRLFLTRSKHMGASLASGFPADACGNRLIVQGYRHDMTLTAYPTIDETGALLGLEWVCEDKVQQHWVGKRRVNNWSWQAWSERYGFPKLVDVFAQRLVLASTDEQPQNIWMSRTDDLVNFAQSDSDTGALCLEMATTSQNPICWMMAQNSRLLLGTSDGEWVVRAGSSGGISASNAWLESHGHVGSADVSSLGAVDKVLYIERGGGRCYEYGYNYETDGYRSKDLTVFAPHVLRDHGGVVTGTLSRKPDTVAIFVLGDGQVALCTYNTHHQVNAWHRWVTRGEVKDVCAVPDGDNEDRLYFITERNGVREIEVVDKTSPYEDRGVPYESILITNGLINPLEAKVGKQLRLPVAVLLGTTCETKGLELSGDGETWVPVSRHDAVMAAGWNEFVVQNKWSYEPLVGLRYRFNTGCHILALQG